jgi:hypothetical protein
MCEHTDKIEAAAAPQPRTEQNIQDLPPGFYWGKMDVRECHGCGGRGTLFRGSTQPSKIKCARCNGLGYLYKVVEMEPMGKGHQPEPTVEILPPDHPPARLGHLEAGSYFRCQNGEAAYLVTRQERHQTVVQMVGKKGPLGVYLYSPDKKVVRLHLTSIQFREADR